MNMPHSDIGRDFHPIGKEQPKEEAIPAWLFFLLLALPIVPTCIVVIHLTPK